MREWHRIPRARRYITLGDGTHVTVAAYSAAWRACVAAAPGTEFRRGLCGYGSRTREEILGEFRDGVHDRINRHAPGFGAGRKWDSEWQRAADRTAREVNTPRLIVRWVPRDFEARLRHRVRRYEDD